MQVSRNTIHVLLGNSDRRLNNLIEVAVRDVCYGHAQAECIVSNRLDDMLHRGCRDNFDLLVIAPLHLVSGPVSHASQVSMHETREVIQSIKATRNIPIIVIGVGPQEDQLFLEAGADQTFGCLIDRDHLRVTLRHLLNLAEPVEEEPGASRWSFGAGLFRAFQKLGQS